MSAPERVRRQVDHPFMTYIPTAKLRELAVKASCDPQTIKKALRGDAIKGLPGERARRALKEAGYKVPKPKAWKDPRSPSSPEPEGGDSK